MPEQLEERLQREAAKKFPTQPKRQNAYVYGTLRHKTGWKPLRIKQNQGKNGAAKV